MKDKDQQKLLNIVLAVLALWVVWKLVNHTHDKVILEGQDPDEGPDEGPDEDFEDEDEDLEDEDEDFEDEGEDLDEGGGEDEEDLDEGGGEDEEDFDDKDEGLDEDLDEDPDEDLDEGYGNSVEAYAKYEGFADLYEGQDNENDDEGQAEGDDTCKPFSDIQDCKEIKGKSGPIKKLRRACKTCKK
jgi:hypothetical protein